MLKAFTWPSSSEATLLPVPDVLNVNEPVGLGGFTTSRASRRMSVPNLMVWRPRVSEKVSRYSVTEVVNLLFAAEVGPTCWYPATAKIGRTDANEFVGRPGTVMSPFCSDVWFRSRRVYPKRAAFIIVGDGLQSYSATAPSPRVIA